MALPKIVCARNPKLTLQKIKLIILSTDGTELRDVNKWSQKMKQPMIDIYGEEFFAKYWVEWIDGMVNIYNKQNGDLCSELLKDIKCPTFILYGEKDPMVDRVHVSHLHTHIEGSRIHLYPEGKHNIHLKYAEDFNRRVQEFLLLPL